MSDAIYEAWVVWDIELEEPVGIYTDFNAAHTQAAEHSCVHDDCPVEVVKVEIKVS